MYDSITVTVKLDETGIVLPGVPGSFGMFYGEGDVTFDWPYTLGVVKDIRLHANETTAEDVVIEAPRYASSVVQPYDTRGHTPSSHNVMWYVLHEAVEALAKKHDRIVAAREVIANRDHAQYVAENRHRQSELV